MSVSLQVKVLRNSGKALLVEDEFGEESWVPLSQIEAGEIDEDSEAGDEGEMTVSDWIAGEKGWE